MANVDIRDVRIPFAETDTGDLDIVTGRELASQRVVYGYSTAEGDIVHRPTWGASLEEYSNKPPTPTNINRLTNQAERFLLTLPFLDEFSVEVVADGESALVQTRARTLEEELIVPDVRI